MIHQTGPSDEVEPIGLEANDATPGSGMRALILMRFWTHAPEGIAAHMLLTARGPKCGLSGRAYPLGCPREGVRVQP